MASILFQRIPRLLLCPMGQMSVVALVLLMVPVSLTHAAVTERLSPPGKLVDVGSHRLHIFCMGQGGPTVVMDSGLGGVSIEWTGVQRLLSQHVRVCTYDRAGYGWSEPGPLPRTSSRIADELFALLEKAEIGGPYILVGHSFGGYTMQLFASRYPAATAGLVLVDSSHPEQVQRFLKPPIRVRMAPSGKNGFMMLSAPSVPDNLPDDLRPTVQALCLKGKAKVALGSELMHFQQSASQLQEAEPLPDVPTVVLTRGKHLWPQTHRGELMEQLWMKLQTELAARSPRAAHIVAERSGHHIHLDQPELVADTVYMVITVARHDSTASAGRPAVNGHGCRAFKDASWRSDHIETDAPTRRIQSRQRFRRCFSGRG